MKTHNYIWHALGMNGVILNWWPAEKSKFSAPQIEMDLSDIKSPLFEKAIIWSSGGSLMSANLEDQEMIKEFILQLYQAWGKFGPYGDLIQISYDRDRGQAHVDFIGRLAFPKPSLAADLVPIIRDAKGNLFFVGITRKKEPGIGKPALIGGHLDIKGYHLETAVEAVTHEAMEEAGLGITFGRENRNVAINKPFVERITATVIIGNRNLWSELLLVGTFETSTEDNLPKLGIKRVFQTTAYTLIIDIRDQAFTPDEIANLFTAGDDAASIYAHKITSLQSPPFAIKHHRTIYRATLAKLLKEQRINIK